MAKHKLKFDKLQTRDLETIYQLTEQLSRLGDEQNILSSLLDQLIKHTGAEVGAFIAYNADGERFEPQTVKTSNGQDESSIQFSSTVFQQVRDTEQAVLSFDTGSDDTYQDARSVIMNDIHAILAFPLIIHEQLYGIMYFDSRRNRQAFNEGSRQFLSLFSVIASLALEQVLSKEQIERENVQLKNRLQQSVEVPQMLGQSEAMQKVFRMIHKVAQSDVSVIIRGENGTGKDLAARAIHDLSARKDKPFIAQYIGNIPSSLVESELFGYKKGAFTGATGDKTGLFEAANGGTLFLDEIGDLSPDLQVKLLRVLQNREIRRLGENTVRKIDVRIIVATNRDLAQMVKEGTFREDLFYRLNVIRLHMPSLRDRVSDIPLLADHFLRGKKIKLSRAALGALQTYSWPGNVRQLDNVLQRASILAAGERIEPEDLQLESETSETKGTALTGSLEAIKNEAIIQRLKQFDGNKTHTAKSLNISLRSLQAKVKELGL